MEIKVELDDVTVTIKADKPSKPEEPSKSEPCCRLDQGFLWYRGIAFRRRSDNSCDWLDFSGRLQLTTPKFAESQDTCKGWELGRYRFDVEKLTSTTDSFDPPSASGG